MSNSSPQSRQSEWPCQISLSGSANSRPIVKSRALRFTPPHVGERISRTLLLDIRVVRLSCVSARRADGLGSRRGIRNARALSGRSAHSRNVGAKRVDAHLETIRFETVADGFERMALIESGFDLGPKHSDLGGLGARLFLAEGGEAASSS